MPCRAAASAHWYFRCSVGVTTVTEATVRSASSSVATRSPNVVLPAPGVAAARKSRGPRARYLASALRCQARRGGVGVLDARRVAVVDEARADTLEEAAQRGGLAEKEESTITGDESAVEVGLDPSASTVCERCG